MNKVFVTVTIIFITVLIIGVTTYKVLNEHNAKLTKVEEKYIIEAAKKCLNEKECSGTTVTLQTLYDLSYLSYLDFQADPVTKEYYNPDSFVKYEDATYTFVSVR